MPAVKSTGTFDIPPSRLDKRLLCRWYRYGLSRCSELGKQRRTYKRYRAGQKSLVCIVSNREGVSGSNIECSGRFYSRQLDLFVVVLFLLQRDIWWFETRLRPEPMHNMHTSDETRCRSDVAVRLCSRAIQSRSYVLHD